MNILSVASKFGMYAESGVEGGKGECYKSRV